MISAFTDKTLQIASQLAYFNYPEIANNEAGTMVGRLRDIFKRI